MSNWRGKSCISKDQSKGRTSRKGKKETVRGRTEREELVTWTDPWLSSWSSDCSQDRWMRWTDGQMSGTAPCSWRGHEEMDDTEKWLNGWVWWLDWDMKMQLGGCDGDRRWFRGRWWEDDKWTSQRRKGVFEEEGRQLVSQRTAAFVQSPRYWHVLTTQEKKSAQKGCREICLHLWVFASLYVCKHVCVSNSSMQRLSNGQGQKSNRRHIVQLLEQTKGSHFGSRLKDQSNHL